MTDTPASPREPVFTAGIGFLVMLLLVGAPAKAAEVTVGGWAAFVFADTDRSSDKWTFDAHPLYLYVEAEPTEGWKFFGEIEGEHVFQFRAGATGAGELKLERLYVERAFSSAHNVRGGKFFLPLGLWYRLHWHFLTETYSRPFTFANAYAPRAQVGLEYWGRAARGNTAFNYYAWLTTGPDVFGTNRRTVSEPGYGASAFATHKLGGDAGRTLELSLGYHQQTALVGTSEDKQGNLALGAELKLSRVEARVEFYEHSRKVTDDFSSWYASGLVWVRPRVGLSYRLDRGEDLTRTRTATDHEATAHSVGVVWRPRAQVLLKSEYRLNVFRDPTVTDYDEWNVFVGIKF